MYTYTTYTYIALIFICMKMYLATRTMTRSLWGVSKAYPLALICLQQHTSQLQIFNDFRSACKLVQLQHRAHNRQKISPDFQQKQNTNVSENQELKRMGYQYCITQRLQSLEWVTWPIENQNTNKNNALKCNCIDKIWFEIS